MNTYLVQTLIGYRPTQAQTPTQAWIDIIVEPTSFHINEIVNADYESIKEWMNNNGYTKLHKL